MVADRADVQDLCYNTRHGVFMLYRARLAARVTSCSIMEIGRGAHFRRTCAAVAIAGIFPAAVACTQNTYVVPPTTTKTETATIEIPASPVADYSGRKTVQQALDEGNRRDFLVRAAEAGFSDWSVGEVTDIALQFCDDLWVGGEFERVVDELSMNRARADVLAIYSATAGAMCNLPPGAPTPTRR
jgi:hypothetical protein